MKEHFRCQHQNGLWNTSYVMVGKAEEPFRRTVWMARQREGV